MRFALRRGFTLIEVLFASFIFGVGVLALEASAAASLQRMRRSADLTLAASVARSRLEVLASSRCTDLTSGSDTVRTVISTWTIEPASFASVRAVSQTISYSVDGAPRTDLYRAVFPCTP